MIISVSNSRSIPRIDSIGEAGGASRRRRVGASRLLRLERSTRMVDR